MLFQYWPAINDPISNLAPILSYIIEYHFRLQYYNIQTLRENVVKRLQMISHGVSTFNV